jgi:small-conductance mechanosensitive channel
MRRTGSDGVVKRLLRKTTSKAVQVVAGIAFLVVAHLAGTALRHHLAQPEPPKGHGGATAVAPPLAYGLLGGVAYWGVMAIALMGVLGFLGVEVTGIIAVLGTIGFSVGLGVQGIFSDVAAGVTLSLTKKFAVGDIIRHGEAEGKVVAFSLLTTVLLDTSTNALVFIPNRKMNDATLHNMTPFEKAHVTLHVTVSNKNGTLLRHVLPEIERAIMAYPGVFSDPPTVAKVSGVTMWGSDIEVRVTIRSSDYPTENNVSYQDALMTVLHETLVDNGVLLVTNPPANPTG